MKLKKSVIFVIVLIVWSVFSLVFIAWSSWQNFQAKKVQVAFNNGASQGYQQAFIDIATAAQKCEAVPLNLGKDKDGKDQTMEIVATACLKQTDDKGQGAPANTEAPKK